MKASELRTKTCEELEAMLKDLKSELEAFGEWRVTQRNGRMTLFENLDSAINHCVQLQVAVQNTKNVRCK